MKVLSDPHKRAICDQYGEEVLKGQRPTPDAGGLHSSIVGMAQQCLGSTPEMQRAFLLKFLAVQAHMEEWEVAWEGAEA